jgi:hypothetical protein
MIAMWYLILVLSGTGKEIEVVPMQTAAACETARDRYIRAIRAAGVVGYEAAVCVKSGAP